MLTPDKVIPWIISIGSLIFAWWTNTKKDTKDSTVVIATVTAELKSMNENMTELTRQMREMNNEQRDHERRLILLEQKFIELKEDLTNAKRG